MPNLRELDTDGLQDNSPRIFSYLLLSIRRRLLLHQLPYGARRAAPAGRPRPAPQLRATAGYLDRTGAVPWADRARAELSATGATIRGRHGPGFPG